MKIPFIPYFETTRYRVAAMVELAAPKPAEIMADLGSGDGRIILAFAQKKVPAHGFELNPDLVRESRNEIMQQGLDRVGFIHEKDFWQEDLSPYSIITIYPMPDIMLPLEKKLREELRPGGRVLLNYYQFPTWKLTKSKDHIYLYEKH